MDKLINKTSLEALKNPHKLSDFKSIILYGNKQSFIDMYFLKLLNNLYPGKLIENKVGIWNDNDVVYKYSDFHFEFAHSKHADKYLDFVKAIFNNKPISNNPHIWLIKNLGKESRDVQLSYTRIVEKSIWSQFWFTSESLTIDKAIQSRSLMINLAWGSDRIYNLVKEISSKNNIPVSLDKFKKLHAICGHNIVTYLLANNNTTPISCHDECLDTLLDTIHKQSKAGVIIDNIRDYCYKVFHLNIPFTYIAKYTINYMITKKIKHIDKIIDIFANADVLLHKTNRDLLVYEGCFIKIAKLMN